MLYSYKHSDVRSCLLHEHFIFLGDSTTRQLFWAVSHRLDDQYALDVSQRTEKHTNVTFQSQEAQVHFIWDPFLNTTGSLSNPLASEQSISNSSQGTLNFIVGVGLWHAKYLNDSPVAQLQAAIARATSKASQKHELLESGTSDGLESIRPRARAFWLPVAIPDSFKVSKGLSADMNAALLETTPSHGHKILRSYSQMIKSISSPFKEDGIHVADSIIFAQADVLLNHVCNHLMAAASGKSQAYCCAPYAGPNLLQKSILFTASCAAFYGLFLSSCQGKAGNADGQNFKLTMPESGVASALATISLAVIYCFMADRTVLFDKAPKAVDQNTFACLAAFSLLGGMATSKRTEHEADMIDGSKSSSLEYREVLSRKQTEEWKGWMQIFILLYHYFGMSKVLWVYQFVRLLVSSYLFMTGFGHSMYFITTNDFSLRRVTGVLLRTNILSIVLAFVMGTRYDLYYFPALSSLWFLIVWMTISRTPQTGADAHRLIRRITISMLMTAIILRSSNHVESLLGALNSLGLGLLKIDGHEFKFRFSLDAYVVYVGMITAVFCSRHKATPDHTVSGALIQWSRLTSKVVILLAILVILGYAHFCGTFSDKYSYNKWHPLVSPLPVVAFVVLRNSTRTLSTSHSRMFAWFGRCSLETFVLQYHVFLAADSRGLLRLGLQNAVLQSSNSRLSYLCDILEAAIIFTAFLWVSSAVSNALPAVTASLIGPTNSQDNLRRWEFQAGRVPQSSTRFRALGLRSKLFLMLAVLGALAFLCTRFD